MPLAQVNAGDKINASDINQFYSILKGVAASGESVTLIYNAAGSFVLQPSSDPATGTELIQVKNNAGTVQMALSSDGKVYAGDGTAPLPGVTFEADKTTGIYRASAGVMALSTLGVSRATLAAAGLTMSVPVLQAQGASISSATTTDLSTATGNAVTVSGVTTITGFGTVAAGAEFTLTFSGALTLTHNAASLILRGAVNVTTVAGDVFKFVSLGSGNWREAGRLTTASTGGAKALISRFLNSAALNVTNAVSGTYVDFGGSFTTTVTTLAGDQVAIRVQSIVYKATAGHGTIVVDRSGTKLPGTALLSSVVTVSPAVETPFNFEYWDTPGAGTFTYKPQVYTDDNNTAAAGNTRGCMYVVEVWR